MSLPVVVSTYIISNANKNIYERVNKMIEAWGIEVDGVNKRTWVLNCAPWITRMNLVWCNVRHYCVGIFLKKDNNGAMTVNDNSAVVWVFWRKINN